VDRLTSNPVNVAIFRDLSRSRKLVGVGHDFGNVSVLAIMPSQIYPEMLEWTSNVDRLKFNSRLAQIHFNFIGQDIVGVLRRKLGNFRESRKLQTVQTYKIEMSESQLTYGLQPIRFIVWTHVQDPALASFLEGYQSVGCIHHLVVVSCLAIVLFICNAIDELELYCTFVVSVSYVGTSIQSLTV